MDLDNIINNAMLADESNERKQQNSRKLRITRGAMAKIQLYADLTSETVDSKMECYGYLLRPRWVDDDLITNIYFADDQLNSAAHTFVPAEKVKEAVDKCESMDYEIVGWWHSHGGINVFHSGTDIQNFKMIHDGISPNTLYSYQKAAYQVDEERKRVVFGDIALLNLTEEQIRIFKDASISTMKKVQQDPYAFSLVVNNAQDRYLEKMTKTKAGQGFRRNEPFHPTLQVEKVDDDLEFLVADIEWEVREKIIVNDFYSRDRNDVTEYTTEAMDQLEAKVDDFLKKAIVYSATGRFKSAILDIATNARTIYDALSLAQKDREAATLNEEEVEATASKEAISLYLAEIAPEKYGSWAKKIHLFDRQHIIGMKFLDDFIKAAEKGTQAQDKVFQDYSRIAKTLDKSFRIADAGMKALTKYAMESITDYNDEKGHKYKNLIGAILTKMSDDDFYFFEKAVQSSLSNRNSARKQMFIWENRFQICDQLTADVYFYEANRRKAIAKEGGSLNFTKREQTVDFLTKFAEEYERGGDNLDTIIEQRLLSSYMSPAKFAKYDDGSYGRRMTRQGRICQQQNAFDIYGTGNYGIIKSIAADDSETGTAKLNGKPYEMPVKVRVNGPQASKSVDVSEDEIIRGIEQGTTAIPPTPSTTRVYNTQYPLLKRVIRLFTGD
ncbi:Mov34/MPN/PAD-1 family protein [Candidatus Woesearchaeota archaeon]|nr:Mov34/MPN/PAD-1 family protein [Candidatus Woesearchaeota archaeon]